MANSLTPTKAAEIMEAVIARGDLVQLNAEERGKYYVRVCDSIGLNPMTRPFEYINLNGKLTLYARKDATDQLRNIHKVSVTDLIESEHEGVFVVTAKVALPDGRTDAAKGAVAISGLKGDALANALMKAETKAKRRATLSICGLGFLDESEIETIPAAAKAPPVKALLKKDARPDYHALLAELNAQPSIDALGEWREANTERFARLPADWQFRLSQQFEAAIKYLQGESDIPPEEFQGVQWGERMGTPIQAKPAADHDGIPPFLRREAEKPNGAGYVEPPESWC